MCTSDNLSVALKKYSKKRAPDTAALGMIHTYVYIVDVYMMYNK